MSHVFISYAHEDDPFRVVLRNRLGQEGFDVHDDTDIDPGRNWSEEIEKMIREAFAVILVMTPEARDSAYVTFEWAFALGAGVKVIPIMLKSIERHERLSLLQYLDFTRQDAFAWDPLMKAMRIERQAKLLESQIHRYSGRWQVQNNFSRWRGEKIEGNNKVFWRGKSFLFLSPDGQEGTGAQIGNLFVAIGNYRATYKNANLIERAYISDDGSLHIFPKVIHWECEETNGKRPPKAIFAEKLSGSGEYKIELKLVSDNPMKLQGPHEYDLGDEAYQLAQETHEYLGF